ncbi:hypothetical protein OSTOST_12771, partial [Ostertagia ostertagi]
QKAAETARDICSVYGEDAIEGDFDLEDAPHTGRPSDFDKEQLRDLIKEDDRQISRELAEKMDCDHATILRHLHSMEYTQKLGSWVPHKLTEETKARSPPNRSAKSRSTSRYT